MRAAAVALLLCACSRGPVLVVTTAPVPASAAQLQPYLSVDGAPSQDIEPFTPLMGQPTQSFGLRLPPPAGMQAHLGLSVLDSGGCFLATGVADTAVSDGAQIDLQLDVLPAARCDKKRPLLLSASPALGPTTGGTAVSVRGTGLQPGTTVTLGGAQAKVSWRSPMDLAVTTPAHKGIAAVPLVAQGPNGPSDQAAAPFRYYSATPDFTPASHSLSVLGMQISVAAVAMGLLDPNPFPDLVGLVTAPLNGVVVVLNSRLTLTSPMVPNLYGVPGAPVAVALGGLSDTMNVDMAVSVQGDTHVYMLYNQGDGTFWKDAANKIADVVTVKVGGQPGALAIADVNGDGRTDLVLANQSKLLTVLPRVVMRSFAAQQDFGLDLVPRDIAVGDLTGDGRPEVVVVYQGADNGVDVLVNKGDGTFPAAMYRQQRASGTTLHQPVLADFDGDGHLDLAFAAESPGLVSVWLNPDGGFQSPARTDYPVAMRPVALAAGDLNGDGLPDLVTVPADGSNAVLLLNQLAHPGKLQIYGKTYPIETGSRTVVISDAAQTGANDIGVLGTTQLVGLINSSP